MPMVDELEAGEGTADTAYKWTIRALYMVAIGLNVWLLWDAVADDAETQVLKAKWTVWKNKALAPFHLNRTVAKETGPMIWEAQRIMEKAEESKGG